MLKNLFSQLPDSPLPDERIETLLQCKGTRIERILSMGHASPPGFWYDQPEHEWVVVLQGAAQIRFEGSPSVIELSVGDVLDIPAHQRHRVEWTTPEELTIWLAIFMPPE